MPKARVEEELLLKAELVSKLLHVSQGLVQPSC